VANVTPTAVPAAASAATPTTIQTRRRGLIAPDATYAKCGYISESNAEL
jgi:hypothetical protein